MSTCPWCNEEVTVVNATTTFRHTIHQDGSHITFIPEVYLITTADHTKPQYIWCTKCSHGIKWNGLKWNKYTFAMDGGSEVPLVKRGKVDKESVEKALEALPPDIIRALLAKAESKGK